MLSVLLSAHCPPVPLKSLTSWHYTNQIIIIIIIIMIIIIIIIIIIINARQTYIINSIKNSSNMIEI